MRRRLLTASGLMAVAVVGVALAARPASAQQGSNLYQWSGGYGGSSGYSGGSGGYNYNPGYAAPNYAGNGQTNPNQSFYPSPSGRTGWQTRADGWLYYWNQGRVLGAYDRDGDRWYPYNDDAGWSRATAPPWNGR